MSDEQWLWLFVHQRIDADEKLERMCPRCREEVTSEHRCIRCGKEIVETDSFINPNFDIDKYNKLAEASGISDRAGEDEEDDNRIEFLGDEFEDNDITTNNEDRTNLDDDEFYYEDDD